MKRSQVAGTTAEGNSFRWSRACTGWSECPDKARQVSRRQQGIRAWRRGFRTNRSAAQAARGRGGLRVGGLDFPITHDMRFIAWENEVTNDGDAGRRQALGGSSGLSFVR